ncbi:hypothetical protein BC940DRAFT_297256 [Gongronella butleri]|nr:hypothetical protein BC940DRAFT_297256 [Gongronella butleri]
MMNDDIPKHIPVDAGLAPDQDPYRPRKQHADDRPSERTHMSDHSLSPEKLGVAGYVRDVAGFVRDAVHDIHDQRQQKKHDKSVTHGDQDQLSDDRSPRNNDATVATGSTSSTAEPIPTAGATVQAHANATTDTADKNATSPHGSPLADVVTSMFPGISPSNTPGCTHADALRHDMMDQMDQMHRHKENRLV